MGTVKLEVGPGVMVEVPASPVPTVVAGFAARPQASLVYVLFVVAAHAVARYIFISLGFVALCAFDLAVLAN